MEFFLCFSFDNSHFEYWKSMNTKLKQEVNFQFCSFLCRPIRVIFVNFWTLSTTANYWGEPILFSKEDISNNCCEWVKAAVKAQFENIRCFFVSDLSFIFLIDKLIDFVPHKVIVTVFGDLNIRNKFTKIKENPTVTQMRESIAKT